MIQLDKLTKKSHIKTIELSDSFSLDDFIQQLASYKAKYSDYVDLEIHWGGCYDEVDLDLWGTRLETDEEQSKRVEKAKRAQMSREEKKAKDAQKDLDRERAQYERLKVKFEANK